MIPSSKMIDYISHDYMIFIGIVLISDPFNKSAEKGRGCLDSVFIVMKFDIYLPSNNRNLKHVQIRMDIILEDVTYLFRNK